MRCFLILTAILFLLIAGGAAFVWSGYYNVAANVPHWDLTHSFLSTVRERSISTHSRGITPPPSKDPKLIDIGFRNYHAMCRLCHNAPGFSRTETAQGLNPAPPDFTRKDVTMRSDAQVYWIVKNGMKMTGMPAFGSTHSEDELLGTVMFVKRLPNLKSEEYAGMVKAAGLREEGEHHH